MLSFQLPKQKPVSTFDFEWTSNIFLAKFSPKSSLNLSWAKWSLTSTSQGLISQCIQVHVLIRPIGRISTSDVVK